MHNHPCTIVLGITLMNQKELGKINYKKLGLLGKICFLLIYKCISEILVFY